VLEALRAGRDIKRVFVATGAHGEVITEIVDSTRARKISLQSVDRRRLDDMAFNHQGVVAEAAPFEYASLEDVIEAARGSASPLVLVLDVLQDPQNLGSLMRTAAAAGAQGVVIPEHRAVGVTPAVVKASAGAIERLKIAQVTNLSRAIDTLKEAGLWAVGLDADAETAYDKTDLARPLALVVGGEGKGLRHLVRQHCDSVVSLPMPGAIESLNAAVAGSIVIYEALRQRAAGNGSTRGMTPKPAAPVESAAVVALSLAPDLSTDDDEFDDESAFDEVTVSGIAFDESIFDEMDDPTVDASVDDEDIPAAEAAVAEAVAAAVDEDEDEDTSAAVASASGEDEKDQDAPSGTKA